MQRQGGKPGKKGRVKKVAMNLFRHAFPPSSVLAAEAPSRVGASAIGGQRT